ncbi:MAG: putative metal-dependent hydrolase [Cyclobacteriaceae bacterium]|nr:putative metal-dependent hydrolase [Cyclobacteriaceae bacterium HetDA_MAG_MS6]
MNKELEKLKYPIGKFTKPRLITPSIMNMWITTIRTFPQQLRGLIEGLSEEQLNTPYRPKGWTIRQVVHHVGDSHLNSYIRFKWTLTEDKPIIKAYDEAAWAELHDTLEAPISIGLDFLNALHAKWTYLLESLDEAQLNRVFIHPETHKEVSLKLNIGLYDWHCRHHYAHIENLLKTKNWI